MSTLHVAALARATPRYLARACKSLSTETKTLYVLLALSLFNQLLCLTLPAGNGDAMRKWMWSRVVRAGWSPSGALWEGWDHHAARLGINLPTLAVQTLFGDHPALYYVSPLAAHLLAVACVFRIGIAMGGLGVGTVAAGAWTWVVPTSWAGQLMPAAFSPTYVLATIACLIAATRQQRPRRVWLWIGLASGCMMLAELAKITNLFCMPGLMLALYFATGRARLALAFGAGVALLMAIELLGYRLSPLDAPWGRVSIILKEHINGTPPPSKLPQIRSGAVWELLTRQKPVFARIMPGLYLWLFLPIGVASALRPRKLPAPALLVALPALSYLVLHVFAISRLDPLTSVQRALPRYLALMLPLCILSITWAAAHWLLPTAAPADRRRSGWIGAGVGLLLLSHSALSHFSSLAQHPIARLDRYNRMFDKAYQEGIPIVALSQARYGLHGALCLFWDDFASPDHHVPKPGSGRIPRGKKKGKKFRHIFDPRRAGGLKGYRLVNTWRGGQALVFSHRNTRMSMSRRAFNSL